MRIRTANGSLLGWYSLWVLTVVVCSATEIFAQRAPAPPMQGGRTEPVEVWDTGGGSNSPFGSWWLQPNPNIPNPGPGIGNPVGEERRGGVGSSGGPPMASCTISCTCDYKGAVWYMSHDREPNPGCSDLVSYQQFATITKSFNIRVSDCNAITDEQKNTTCRGSAGYSGYRLIVSEVRNPGCQRPTTSRQLHDQQVEDSNMDAIPKLYGSVDLAKGCNGG
jgi:hypothetical protein